MSLLITSSSSKEYTNDIGIEAPNQYTNHLRNPLVIKPKSQIAVDSVKVNRAPVVAYEKDAVCNFWFGKRITDDVLEALNTHSGTGVNQDEELSALKAAVRAQQRLTSYPIIQQNLIDSSVAPALFVQKFAKMCREAYCYHPEINTSYTQNGSICALDFDTDSLKFQFQQELTKPANRNLSASFVQTIFGDADFDETSGCFTCNDEDTLILYAGEGALDGPISSVSGTCKFNVSNTREDAADPTTRQFCVGITRAYNYNNYLRAFNDKDRLNMAEHTGVGRDQDVFFDYCAQSDGDGTLRLYHSVYDQGVGDQKRSMEEILYYNKTNTSMLSNNDLNSCFASGAPINVKNITEIEITIQGEIVTFSDQNGSIISTAVSVPNASYKECVPKPINQNCWKMYPQIYLFGEDDEISMPAGSAYTPRTGTTMDSNIFYGKGDWQARCYYNYFTETVAEKAAGKTRAKQKRWRNAKWWPQDLDARPPTRKCTGGASRLDFIVGDYLGLTDHGSSRATQKDKENIIITGPNPYYRGNFTNHRMFRPNQSQNLGSDKGSNIIPAQLSLSAVLGSSFTAPEDLRTTATNSAFVRLPQFPQTTFNAGKGSISKIVGTIPRFDNSGADTGSLFFEKHDRLYVDLNNTEPIEMTDIKVDIVRSDETFVEDLTGNSEIVFHIREAPK